MTTNQERALALLNDLAERGDDDAVSTVDAVHELAAANLLAPDLPKPYCVEGQNEATVTAWQPCHTVMRTDFSTGAVSEVELPVGNVWIEPDGMIGMDTDHSGMYLPAEEARNLAHALLAATHGLSDEVEGDRD